MPKTMETKHTTGTWTISRYENIAEAKQIWSEKIVNGDQKHIANVFTNFHWLDKSRFCRIDREEQLANAKLIAAAPELFEACNKAFTLCDKLQMPTESELNELKIILIKAIKKASE